MIDSLIDTSINSDSGDDASHDDETSREEKQLKAFEENDRERNELIRVISLAKHRLEERLISRSSRIYTRKLRF